VNIRSSSPRALPLLFALLLLLLQSAAPLLHAHAADDPRAVAVSGLHLPGLEPVAIITGARDVVSERTYPLIEETECCRQRIPSDAAAPSEVRPPRFRAGTAAVCTPPGSAVPRAAPDCPPPPPRAPPPAFSA
jgi:hypothetical protein